MAKQNGKAKDDRKNNYLKYALIALAIIFGGLFLVQIFYPDSNLLIGTEINGKELSGWSKKSAIKELNRSYNNAEIEVYLDKDEESFRTVYPEEFGLEIDNTRRVNSIVYPWYIRIIPTSLFWWGKVAPVSELSLRFDESELRYFVEKRFGTPCYVEPKNASLSIDGSSIQIEKSHVGGICYQSEVEENFRDIKFSSFDSGSVMIDLVVEHPVVSTVDATNLAIEISPNIINDLVLEIDEIVENITLNRDELTSWISFEVIDHQLTPIINEDMSSEFYKTRVAPLVEKNAGVTTIIAIEDTNAVRIDGAEGQIINVKETNFRIVEYLLGSRKTVVLAVESTDPEIDYIYERLQSNQTKNEPVIDSENQDQDQEEDKEKEIENGSEEV